MRMYDDDACQAVDTITLLLTINEARELASKLEGLIHNYGKKDAMNILMTTTINMKSPLPYTTQTTSRIFTRVCNSSFLMTNNVGAWGHQAKNVPTTLSIHVSGFQAGRTLFRVHPGGGGVPKNTRRN